MPDINYIRLAEALDRLPNGFPRTASGIEIRLLKKIFSEEEASLAANLTGTMEPAETIAGRAGLPVSDVKPRLVSLAKQGLAWLEKSGGALLFRLAPFMVGIYEAQLEAMDHELAHLLEEYMMQGGAKGIMGYEPALHRVMPAKGTVKSEWILPYDDVKALLLKAKNFSVRDCICRVEQDFAGHRRCSFPLRNCLSISLQGRAPRPDDISREEAISILDESEKIGLVHTVSNVVEGLGYVCNCCGCCCGILRGITDWGIANSVARANYHAVIDSETCQDCGVCIERCQVKAISDREGRTAIDVKKCIGCGLCVSGCPQEAVSLVKRPESEIVAPPLDFSAWEKERAMKRTKSQKDKKTK